MDEVPVPLLMEEGEQRMLLEGPQQPLQVPLDSQSDQKFDFLAERNRDILGWFIAICSIFFVLLGADTLILCEYCHRQERVRRWRKRKKDSLEGRDWFHKACYAKCLRLYFLDDEPWCCCLIDCCCFCCVCECCCFSCSDNRMILKGIYVAPTTAVAGNGYSTVRYYYEGTDEVNL